MAFAQDKAIERNVLEAAMAAVRAGLVAKLLGAGAHHQAVMMANRVVVMRGRHDDLAVGQGAADNVRKLSAKQQQVVDVDYIRPELAQQLRYIRHHAIEVDLAHGEEAVEMARPQQDSPRRADAPKAACRAFASRWIWSAHRETEPRARRAGRRGTGRGRISRFRPDEGRMVVAATRMRLLIDHFPGALATMKSWWWPAFVPRQWPSDFRATARPARSSALSRKPSSKPIAASGGWLGTNQHGLSPIRRKARRGSRRPFSFAAAMPSTTNAVMNRRPPGDEHPA